MTPIETIELSTLGDPIRVSLRISSKARNISLRIHGVQVELVLPRGASKSAGYKFVLSKEHWIRCHLRNKVALPPSRMIHDQYNMLGETYELQHIETKSKFSVEIEGRFIVARVPRTSLLHALTVFFKHQALTRVTALTRDLAKQHGFKYNSITLKQLKSKWGSCSSSKNLNFNWRLIFAPRPVFHYLVVHELCHLKHMNHSDKFWQLVAKTFPEYKASERWLKQHGYTLYHYLPQR